MLGGAASLPVPGVELPTPQGSLGGGTSPIHGAACGFHQEVDSELFIPEGRCPKGRAEKAPLSELEPRNPVLCRRGSGLELRPSCCKGHSGQGQMPWVWGSSWSEPCL